MKRIIYIFTLLIFGLVVSSCAKSELDPPSENTNPQAITIIKEVQATDKITDRMPLSNPVPSQINDDGDDEDEGTVTNPEKK